MTFVLTQNDSDSEWSGLPASELPTVFRTLMTSGFEIIQFTRGHEYGLFHCRRYDEFGIPCDYVFAASDDELSPAAIATIRKVATRKRAHAVALSSREVAGLPHVSWESLVERLGGPVRSWLPLESTFAGHLNELGRNRLPTGVVGKADDLFEEYVHVALQFVLQQRVIRYGQARRFEVRPDGAILARGGPLTLYDAKAYGEGYRISRDSIRQFADYVDEFHRRYERHIGRIHSFLVISAEIVGDEVTLQERSSELIATCRVPLVTLTTHELGCIVGLLMDHPTLRSSIDWTRIFTRTTITCAHVRADAQAVARDHIVQTETWAPQ